MKKVIILFLSVLLFYILYLCSISVLNGEVLFFNDVARDFHIFREIDEKKIVLIGGRSSTNGLFHGSFWHYINYPAYIFGNGDPVVVGWFWVSIGVFYLISSFLILRKFLGVLAALTYVLFVGIRMPLHINGLFQSNASFFFSTAFVVSMIFYFKTQKVRYLFFHWIILSILAQMNIGTGIQFLFLSGLLFIINLIKTKNINHIFSLLVIPLFMINYILFDIKNEFRMISAIFSTGESGKFFIPINLWIQNRVNNIVNLQLFEQDSGTSLLIIFIFVIVIFFSFLIIKNDKEQRIFFIITIYFYVGYIFMSFFNKGLLLFHYTYLLVPIGSLWVILFLKSRYKYVFFPVVAIVFLINFQYVNSGAKDIFNLIKNKPDSWKGLLSVGNYISSKNDKNFGYYVYAPDAYAYQPRYAMIYAFNKNKIDALEYKKKKITYIVAAPPPADNKYMKHSWWVENSVKIKSKPVETKKFPNGFLVEKYFLSDEEILIDHDKSIELGLHFR